MTERKIRIAVVDDDPSFLRAQDRLLHAAGLEPRTYPSGEALLAERPRPELDCALLDIWLGTMTGFELARKLAAEKWRVPVIFMTAHDDPAARAQAQHLGCVAYLRKPFSVHTLLEAIRQATQPNPVAAEDKGGRSGQGQPKGTSTETEHL